MNPPARKSSHFTRRMLVTRAVIVHRGQPVHRTAMAMNQMVGSSSMLLILSS